MSTTARPDPWASLQLLARFAPGSRLLLAAAIALAMVAVALELGLAWVLYHAAIEVAGGRWTAEALWADVAMAATAVTLGPAAFGGAMALSHHAAYAVIHRLRLAVAAQMARLSPGRFVGRAGGDAKTLVIDEPERLEAIIAHALPEGVAGLVGWLAVTIILLALDWRMAVAAIVTTPLSFLLLHLAMRRGAPRAVDYQAGWGRMNAALSDYMAGIPAMKMFNRTGEHGADAAASIRAFAAVETAWARDYLPLGGWFHALVGANIVVIVPVGLLLLRAGSIDTATLLLFVIIGAGYSRPLLKLFDQFHMLSQIAIGSDLVRRLIDEAPQFDSGRTLPLADHGIRFHDVSFDYGDVPALSGVAFAAAAGRTTALVGASGAGKSSIANLLLRFREPYAGRITIGGVDTRDMGLSQLMDSIAFVSQHSFLFSDTIAANLRLARPDADDAALAAAARAARAHDFITALPQGYATPIGDTGHQLSGGQRQRIAIARAILKDAPIVLLDEPTASLDPENEAAVHAALSELARGKTVLLISHRMNTVIATDHIVMIDRGRVVEQGRHGDLVAAQGRYARMWRDFDNDGKATT